MHRSIPLLVAAALGCGATGQPEVSYPIFARGSAPAPVQAGSWTVTLEVARVALGPIYFCATAAASSELCATALGEYPQAAVIDALDATAVRLGDVTGVVGRVRSVTYDFGVSWLPTQSQPTPSRAAPGGHSAHFEGRAVRGSTVLRFVADVDALPRLQGTLVVEGQRVDADITGPGARLDVRLDAGAWWTAVDFDALLARGEDPVVIAPGSRAHNALVVAMTATAPPVFTWTLP